MWVKDGKKETKYKCKRKKERKKDIPHNHHSLTTNSITYLHG